MHKPEGHLRLNLAGRMNETQILQTQCHNICKLNSSHEAEDNATSREFRRIHPPDRAVGPSRWINLQLVVDCTYKVTLGCITENQ